MNITAGRKVSARSRPKSIKRGGMNKTEQEFSAYLDTLLASGLLLSWRFEAFKVRVTDGFDGTRNAVWYTPDFLAITPDGFFRVYEVKGFEDEKDILRMKCAADVFPAEFFVVKRIAKRDGGGWLIEPV